MRAVIRRWLGVLGLLALVACGGGRGCPADPGAFCVPNQSYCRGDFHCGAVGVCTKACTADLDCQAACQEDVDCGDPDEELPWTCEAAVCVCPREDCPPVTCVQGSCQRACAEDDSCAYDPYGPRT